MNPIVILSFTAFCFLIALIPNNKKFATLFLVVLSVAFFVKYNLNASFVILALVLLNISLTLIIPSMIKNRFFPLIYAATLISIKKIFHLEVTGYSYIVMAASMDIVLIGENRKNISKSFFNLFSFPKTFIGPIANLNQHQVKEIDENAYFYLLKGILKAFLILSLYRHYCPFEHFQAMGRFSDFILLGLWQYINLYLEFSGYSDIVYGIYRSLSKDCPINFERPYLSTTLKDFWNRWHMSLGSYIKNHIYIPLGGNRISTTRTYFNLVIAMTLCGLWHGLTVNFALWGFMQGAGLGIEKYFRLEERISNKYLRWMVVQGYVVVSWSVFFS